MRPDTATRHSAIRLQDYAPPVWLAKAVALDFDLYPEKTRVRAAIRFQLNPARKPDAVADLVLEGEQMTLLGAAIDGTSLDASALEKTKTGLRVSSDHLPRDEFVWNCVVEIDPVSNKSLEGLYVSNGMYCTQCEAEGFRRITYFPDRPDVLSVYSVRIEAPKDSHPVLLSNGIRTGQGEAGPERHWASWTDPHPKPCYLFALVAGELTALTDEFTTASGQSVDLELYVRPGDEDRTDYAMDALKRSMRWDEEAYGREYDLPLFMIVAVDDFNMGAMENKGLNIFNTRLVLASPETATDANYLAIESVIAHEYFHNWTGNRITCRDWFQLCLKEGLTVFRDQQFSEDVRSAEVLRLKEVGMLRARQFREDAGPLSHPVRPEEYIEINNFYTATVYEKGAEIVRMLHRLVGPEAYREALDLYFERHDGQACTIEDFRQCFEDATGRDLSQFALWWSQAGTPRVTAALKQMGEKLALTLTQRLDPTPGQDVKAPMLIPFAVGFLGEEGAELQLQGPDGMARGTHLIEMTKPSETFEFVGATGPTVPSLLRGFSAPVVVEYDRDDAERAFLLAHDTDAFNRWESGRELALRAMSDNCDGKPQSNALPVALRHALERGGDPAFLALLLSIPRDDELAGSRAALGLSVDPDAIHAACSAMRRAVAREAEDVLRKTYESLANSGPYSPDGESAGRRSLRNSALQLLAALGPETAGEMAEKQFAEADNMTDSLAALQALILTGSEAGDRALEIFGERWKHDPLTRDKWVAVQANAPREDALERSKTLRARDDIDWVNPNRFRALMASFAANHWRFHARDGSGYRFFADQLEWLDASNPQTTARMATAFETWRRYDEGRQGLMRAEMQRLSARKDCSRDLFEIVTKLLGEGKS